MKQSAGHRAARQRVRSAGRVPPSFQEEVRCAVADGKSGVLHAPPGSGKTTALLAAAYSRESDSPMRRTAPVPRLLWISPHSDYLDHRTAQIAQEARAVGLHRTVAVATASFGEQQRRRTRIPDALVATPEHLHLLFSHPGHQSLFGEMDLVVVDAWQELCGTRRGVVVELACAHLRRLAPEVLVWGSAEALDNPHDALRVLCGAEASQAVLIEQQGGYVLRPTVVPERPARFCDAGLSGCPVHINDGLYRSGHYEYETAVRPEGWQGVLAVVALRRAVAGGTLDCCTPLHDTFDLLAQYCITSACAGITTGELYAEIASTTAFAGVSRDDLTRLLEGLSTGSTPYGHIARRLHLSGDSCRIADAATALQHRLHIASCAYGQHAEPSLSPQIAAEVRTLIAEAAAGELREREMAALAPVFAVQRRWSALPGNHEVLVEYIATDEGYHLCLYPFAGRAVHQPLAAVLALRLSRLCAGACTATADEYGIGLCCTTDCAPERLPWDELCTGYNLDDDVCTAVDIAERVRARFRGNLRSAGAGGAQEEEHRLRVLHDCLFDALGREHPLVRQVWREAHDHLHLPLLHRTLARLSAADLLLTRPKRPTPLAFPLIARMIARCGTEEGRLRVNAMQQWLEHEAGEQAAPGATDAHRRTNR